MDAGIAAAFAALPAAAEDVAYAGAAIPEESIREAFLAGSPGRGGSGAFTGELRRSAAKTAYITLDPDVARDLAPFRSQGRLCGAAFTGPIRFVSNLIVIR